MLHFQSQSSKSLISDKLETNRTDTKVLVLKTVKITFTIVFVSTGVGRFLTPGYNFRFLFSDSIKIVDTIYK